MALLDYSEGRGSLLSYWRASGAGQHAEKFLLILGDSLCHTLAALALTANRLTSLKSNGYVNNVFMHTSTTPAANNGYTNPNPAVGFGLIQLKQNFNCFLGMQATFAVPTATSTKIDNSALTVGQVYVISTLGDATAANWLELGVPAGVTPAVGVAFTALVVGVTGEANTSTSRVMLPTSSGIDLIEVVGVTNNMTATNIATNNGQWVVVQFSKSIVTMSAYTPAGTVAAPVFTGSALATHTHDLFLKNGAVVDGTTTTVNAGTNLLGANTGSDITVAGSGVNGGIVAASAGTPAGTNSAPAFTGSAASLTGTVSQLAAAPATGSICNMRLYFDASSVTIDGI